MYKFFLSTFLCALLSIPLFGQEISQHYKAFFSLPEKANDSLYSKLKLVKDANEKLHLLEIIAEEYIRLGATDSIFHYGNVLKEATLKNKNQLKKGDYYLSKAYSLLGKGSYQKGLYDEALKYYIKGVELSENTDEELMYYEHCLGLGSVYLQQSSFEKALKYLNISSSQNKSIEVKARAYTYLGNYYFTPKDIDKSKANYKKAITYLKEYKSPKLKLIVKIYLGRIASYEQNNERALQYFQEVKNTAIASGFYDIYIESVLQIGKIYISEKNYEFAEITLSIAYTNAIQWNKLALQKRVLNSLTKLYVSKGDYKNAYSLVTQHVAVSNQITENQNSKVIKDLEYKYQTLEKEKEIFTLKEEQLLKEIEIDRQKTIKNAFFIGFLIVLIPIMALLYVYYQKLQTQSKLNATQEEVNQQKITSLMKEQELKLIKASIQGQDEERNRISRELHDSIGGNLAAIKLQVNNLEENISVKKNILEQLDITYNQVRDISHDLVREKFNQNIFTSVIEEYIATLNNASNAEITFIPYPKDKVNAISNDLQVEIFKIIQELLTNTLKHAIANNIDVYLNVYQNELQLLFEDDGIGFDMKTVKEGIGLMNIKTRTEALNASLNIDSTLNRGTAFTIEIPIV